MQWFHFMHCFIDLCVDAWFSPPGKQKPNESAFSFLRIISSPPHNWKQPFSPCSLLITSLKKEGWSQNQFTKASLILKGICHSVKWILNFYPREGINDSGTSRQVSWECLFARQADFSSIVEKRHANFMSPTGLCRVGQREVYSSEHGKEFMLEFLFSSYCIVFHVGHYKPTFVLPCIENNFSLLSLWVGLEKLIA